MHFLLLLILSHKFRLYLHPKKGCGALQVHLNLTDIISILVVEPYF
nr:MAG TPA: hypothetical protein [Caudoviricetes sp.]